MHVSRDVDLHGDDVFEFVVAQKGGPATAVQHRGQTRLLLFLSIERQTFP